VGETIRPPVTTQKKKALADRQKTSAKGRMPGKVSELSILQPPIFGFGG
jgi:hypothetical protein